MKVEWKSCFRVGVSVFLLYLCITYWSGLMELVSLVIGAGMPMLIGCVIAYLVNILMRVYEKHYFPKSEKKAAQKSRRPVCMLLAIVTLVLVVLLVICLILPQLWSCVQVISAGLPGMLAKAVDWVEETGILPEDMTQTLESVDWRSKMGQILQVLTSGIGSVMDVLMKTLTSVFSGVVSGLLSLIFAVYLLLGKERLGRQFHKVCRHYLKESWYQKLCHVIETVDDCFHKYVVGQCTEAVIIGGLCTIGMLILQLPYALMIGALVAFTALIPVAGAYIGAIVGAFMILIQSPLKALIFLVFIIVLQQLEGNIIYPRVVGSSLGLPGIWVLTAVTIGGGILGIVGMLLGVPLAAAVYRFIQEDVNGTGDNSPQKSAVQIEDTQSGELSGTDAEQK